MDARYIEDFLAGVDEFMEAHPDALLYCGEYGVIHAASVH